MSPRTELIGALVVSALVLVAIHLTTRIDLSFSAGLNVFTGPRGYPGVILGAMLILALILVARSARRVRAEPGPPAEAAGEAAGHLPGRTRAALAYLAFGLFVLVFEPLGYILAMSPLLVVISVLSGARRWPVVVAASFAMTFVCLLAFRYGLDTVLPEGIFGIDMIF